MKIGNREFDFINEYYVMGILNVTPDSFSDGGSYVDIEEARKQVARMIDEGADIIDVGGESTRPTHEPVIEEEELRRVIPVIKMIKEKFDTVISIDTSKAEVARQAILSGADMVNDVWGMKKDPNMAEVVKTFDVPVCLMHNQIGNEYEDLLKGVKTGLKESLDIAKNAGIDDNKIILDVGIGFGKTTEQNLEVLANMEKFDFGYPLLLGTSRKSVIGNTLDLVVDDRLEGTLVTTVLGMTKGASIFRVHDVKENYRAIKMAKAILEREKND